MSGAVHSPAYLLGVDRDSFVSWHHYVAQQVILWCTFVESLAG
jgi:hypothetical protein